MIKIKQGNTFSLDVVVTENKVPIDITLWNIRSQLRKSGVLTDELLVSRVNDASGHYKLTESEHGVTTSWEVGTHDCDIEYYIGDEILSTETFIIEVQESVTRDEPVV